MANKAKMENKRWVVKALTNLDSVSYYLANRLAEAGYVQIGKVKMTDGVGRKSNVYVPSKKGENLVRLSKNWPKKAA